MMTQHNRYGLVALLSIFFLVALGLILFQSRRASEVDEAHYQRQETEVRIANLTHAVVSIHKAGTKHSSATDIPFSGTSIWLPPGDYFLKAHFDSISLFYPIPLQGYHSGADEDGSYTITIRSLPSETPPRILPDLPDFAFIPSGWFAFGDRQNPNEQHLVWITGFFVAPIEATNGEFRTFLKDPDGYSNDTHWTEEGKRWKTEHHSSSTALMDPKHPDYPRFGKGELPVTWVNWYEASAYCSWLTEKVGAGKWSYQLPTEEEWEKVARGPESFDYGLSRKISDEESPLYNWRKNPDAPVTIVGWGTSRQIYSPNQYGVYHMSGNVTEWTTSRSAYSIGSRRGSLSASDKSIEAGRFVIRGGSWYSASTATLYIPFRDSFQPEHSTQEIGFRVIARRLPSRMGQHSDSPR